jgi:hypothetical protein
MALREGCNNDEIRKLKEAFEETGDWEKAKKFLPQIDPKSLDAGFKDFITKGKVQKSKKLTKAEQDELAQLEAAEKNADPLK